LYLLQITLACNTAMAACNMAESAYSTGSCMAVAWVGNMAKLAYNTAESAYSRLAACNSVASAYSRPVPA